MIEEDIDLVAGEFNFESWLRKTGPVQPYDGTVDRFEF